MIVYVNLCRACHKANGFEQMIRRKIPDNTEYIYTIEDLKSRIQRAIYDIDVIIFDICQATPISEIIECRNDLKDINIILILNDISSDRHIEQLLKLYPRYMTFGSGDDAIISVLKNRIQYRQASGEKKKGNSNDVRRKGVGRPVSSGTNR